jgi:predicted nucleic acid-binding protein
VIGLDSSAVVRYLTNDDPDVASQIETYIEGAEPVQISAPVLLEAVHVLRSRPYSIAKPNLADTLVNLLTHENVTLSGLDSELAASAIRGARELSPRHLADALIAAAARDAGCRVLLTTDEKFVTNLVPIEQLRQ